MHWPNPDNFAPCNPTPRSGERGSRLFEFSLGAGLVLLATCTERYRGSVTVFVLPLFSHFGGATANRQAPAPITAKEAAVRRRRPPRPRQLPVSCVPKRQISTTRGIHGLLGGDGGAL